MPTSTLDTPVFTGRLGYACLNTMLRAQKPSIFSSRTTRLANIRSNGVESTVKELAKQNLKDLETILEWNDKHGIKFFRLSSDMFSFASHAEVAYGLEFVDEDLKRIGEWARVHGHRLTMHPGQYTTLASPRPEVIENARRDLEHHCEILDRMQLDQDSVIVLHLGGAYGDKQGAIQRWEEEFLKLPENVRNRIVLENDDGGQGYSIAELLPTSEKLQVPLVIDWHHDSIVSSPEPAHTYLDAVNAVWRARGIRPKQHVSEPAHPTGSAMQRRKHADRVSVLPPGIMQHCLDFDIMLECKHKEQAVFDLFEKMSIREVDPMVRYAINKEPPKPKTERKKKGEAVKGKGKRVASDDDEEEEGEEGEETVAVSEEISVKTEETAVKMEDLPEIKVNAGKKSAKRIKKKQTLKVKDETAKVKEEETAVDALQVVEEVSVETKSARRRSQRKKRAVA